MKVESVCKCVSCAALERRLQSAVILPALHPRVTKSTIAKCRMIKTKINKLHKFWPLWRERSGNIQSFIWKFKLTNIHFYSSLTDVKFGPPKFVGQISVHFGSLRQMYCNLNWKSPGLVTFSVNLTHFGANLTSLYHINMAVLNDENLDTLFIIQIFLYLVQGFF